ncbi:CMT1A duplicated region transcript 4 protein isoform X4 [Hyaena hyaena]|uniref:CMT1A duplicated region transcript 4 protein isoform X4 n=1 Tax=Hyaena hyaena TaxID=95912 RepID=UPI0019222B58|nr:CMT1A duplicated region transcript 4 protein isoform X4 [Hyaena hyaena]
MSYTRDLQELPDGRRQDKKRSEAGIWAFNVKNSLMMAVIEARKKKRDEELTENIGLPLNLLEKHSPWPAYVTYTSPMVRKLIEKSKARDLDCMQAFEESQQASRQSKPSSIMHQKRRKSSKSSGNTMVKDMRIFLAPSGTGPHCAPLPWAAGHGAAVGGLLRDHL